MTTRFCLICTFLCGIYLTKAQGILLAADSLLANGQYLAARVSYERVLFASNQSADMLYWAISGKTQCLKQQGLYASAVTFLNEHVQNSLPDSLLLNLRYEQVLCAYLNGQFEQTLSLIERFNYLHPGKTTPALLRVIHILALNELRRWPEAAILYQELCVYLSMSTSAGPYQQLPVLKSEKKAEWLATFIPGAGQFYAGRTGEGIISAIVQLAGLYFGVSNWVQGYYLSAWGIGAGLFGSFHSGGIRRSQILVQELNDKRANAFNAQARQQLTQRIPLH